MARRVKVAAVSFRHGGGPTVEDSRRRMAGLLEQAVAGEPDIIALPETFVSQGVSYTSLEEIAETLPGPTTDLVAEYARSHGCYIICPLIATHGDRYMNDAVLIDRAGQIVGVYSKIHPVVQGSEFRSLELGVTPGQEAPVFDTDFGRIGIQICFDILYPNTWAELKSKGAEVVFWCSAYDGGKHLGIHAWTNHYYVVSAVQSHLSQIIDIMGETLVASGRHDPIVAHVIDLDVGLFHCDFNATVIPDLHKAYGSDITLRMWHEEGFFTLETNREDLGVADIVNEFGLESLEAYVDRNRVLQDAMREGRPVPDLTPPYLGRAQWV